MNRIIATAVAALALASFTACGDSATAGAPAVTPAASSTGATPSASQSWDCGPSSTLGQGEWLEHCYTAEPSATQAAAMDADSWVFIDENTGAAYTIHTKAEAATPKATQLRNLYKQAGVTAHIWAVDVDNMTGSKSADMRKVSFALPTGEAASTLQGATDYMGIDDESAGVADDGIPRKTVSVDTYNQAVHFGNANMGNVLPGTKGVWLIGTVEDISTATRVFAVNDYYDEIEATPVS